MMEQKELRSFSDRSLEEMRMELVYIVNKHRDIEFFQNLYNIVCEEIATRQADREFIEQEQAANDIGH